jgi:ElaB/YqjD/DUF883 family membrane-anchored ribosome-binding protein
MGQEPGEVRQGIERTRADMSDTVDALAHKADVPSRIKESVADKRDRLRQQMSGTASRVNEATPDGSDVTQGARRAAGIAQENPIGLALGGVAVGFIVGLTLPSTTVEDQRLGPISDDVKQTARETGQEALERGKEVAQQTASTAVETAQEAASQQADEMRSSGDGGSAESGSSEPEQSASQATAPGVA